MLYYLLAVNTPFNNSLLSYTSKGERTRGEIVEVPLGKRRALGVVLTQKTREDVSSEVPLESIKPIFEETLSPFKIPHREIDLFEWISEYYHYPLGLFIFSVLPKFMKRPRQLNFLTGENHPLPFAMNSDQAAIFKKISSKISASEATFQKFLIHGVTGSGKTLVYLNLIIECLNKNKSVLFLLPEINLTPQFLETITKYVNAPVYSYNSSLGQSDRYGLWKDLIENEKPRVIIGVRSSVLLPISNLGLIIVDEEHDTSFKQEGRCSYHARDVALKKASLFKIPVVLGSATPSLESYYLHKEQNSYFTLKSRVEGGALPQIKLVDTKSYQSETWPFSGESLDEMKMAFEKGEQVLVFVNKLGYAQYLQCRACGHHFECPNCHTHLRVFKKKNEFHCHVCDHKEVLAQSCPVCGNLNLNPKGFGTEKVLEVLEREFPNRVTKRFDRDEITTFSKLQETLGEFHAGAIDILVGTQMLSKGHNFKRVNLVVILGIDSQLNFPDFRANERVYQTLGQVSGRSGRYEKESKVIIQTMCPDNKIFSYIINQDFDGFYRDEISMRKDFALAPPIRLCLVGLTHKSQEALIKYAQELTYFLNRIKEKFSAVEYSGPRPAVIEKRVNKFHWVLLVRSNQINQLHNFIKTLKNQHLEKFSGGYSINIDPQYFD